MAVRRGMFYQRGITSGALCSLKSEISDDSMEYDCESSEEWEDEVDEVLQKPSGNVTLADLMVNKSKCSNAKSSHKRKRRTRLESANDFVPKVIEMERKFGPLDVDLPVHLLSSVSKRIGFKNQNIFAIQLCDSAWMFIKCEDELTNSCAVEICTVDCENQILELRQSYDDISSLKSDVKKALQLSRGNAISDEEEDDSLLVSSSYPTQNLLPKPTFICDCDDSNSDSFTLESCGHSICKKCLIDIVDGGTTEPVCFQCGSRLDDSVCLYLLGPSRWKRMRESRRHKTQRKCSCGANLSLPNEIWYDRQVSITCPQCANEFCCHCGDIPHWPATCETLKKHGPVQAGFSSLPGFQECWSCETKWSAVHVERRNRLKVMARDKSSSTYRSNSFDQCWVCGELTAKTYRSQKDMFRKKPQKSTFLTWPLFKMQWKVRVEQMLNSTEAAKCFADFFTMAIFAKMTGCKTKQLEELTEEIVVVIFMSGLTGNDLKKRLDDLQSKCKSTINVLSEIQLKRLSRN